MRKASFPKRRRYGGMPPMHALLALCLLLPCLQAGAAALCAAPNDLAKIDGLIEANGLAYPTSTADGFMPDMWDFAQWDAGQPRRVVSLQLDGMGLSGVLDVGGMDALRFLSCSDNEITAIDLSGLDALTVLQCVNTPLLSLTTPQGVRLRISGAAHGYVLTAAGKGSDPAGSLGYDVATGEVTLRAITAGNARFTRWEIFPSVAATRDSGVTSATLSFVLAGDTAVVPVFAIGDAVRATGENAPSTIPAWLIVAVFSAIGAYGVVVAVSAIRYRMSLRTTGRYRMPQISPLREIALQNAPGTRAYAKGKKAKR